jgi:hypothetical protein
MLSITATVTAPQNRLQPDLRTEGMSTDLGTDFPQACLSQRSVRDLASKIRCCKSIDVSAIRVVKLASLLVCLVTILIGEYSPLRRDEAAAFRGRPLPKILSNVRQVGGPKAPANLEVVLARPIFSETRRPPADAASESFQPRLTGVLVSNVARTAIFAVGSSHKLIALAEGGSLGPNVVQSIIAGQVTMSGPDGTRVLHPTFDFDRDNRSTESKCMGGNHTAPAQIYKGPALNSPSSDLSGTKTDSGICHDHPS